MDLSSNVTWLLFGFIFAQIYTYYRRSARDPFALKMLVYSLLVVVMAERALNGFYTYMGFVTGWGNPLIYISGTTSFVIANNLQLIFTALPATPVQLFFTWRIWTFCMAVCERRMKLVVAVICFFIACTSICA